MTAKLNIDQKLQLAAGDAERQLVFICSYSIPAQLLNTFYKTKLYVNVFFFTQLWIRLTSNKS